jgi:hypothetical protein
VVELVADEAEDEVVGNETAGLHRALNLDACFRVCLLASNPGAAMV